MTDICYKIDEINTSNKNEEDVDNHEIIDITEYNISEYIINTLINQPNLLIEINEYFNNNIDNHEFINIIIRNHVFIYYLFNIPYDEINKNIDEYIYNIIYLTIHMIKEKDVNTFKTIMTNLIIRCKLNNITNIHYIVRTLTEFIKYINVNQIIDMLFVSLSNLCINDNYEHITCVNDVIQLLNELIVNHKDKYKIDNNIDTLYNYLINFHHNLRYNQYIDVNPIIILLNNILKIYDGININPDSIIKLIDYLCEKHYKLECDIYTNTLLYIIDNIYNKYHDIIDNTNILKCIMNICFVSSGIISTDVYELILNITNNIENNTININIINYITNKFKTITKFPIENSILLSKIIVTKFDINIELLIRINSFQFIITDSIIYYYNFILRIICETINNKKNIDMKIILEIIDKYRELIKSNTLKCDIDAIIFIINYVITNCDDIDDIDNIIYIFIRFCNVDIQETIKIDVSIFIQTLNLLINKYEVNNYDINNYVMNMNEDDIKDEYTKTILNELQSHIINLNEN